MFRNRVCPASFLLFCTTALFASPGFAGTKPAAIKIGSITLLNPAISITENIPTDYQFFMNYENSGSTTVEAGQLLSGDPPPDIYGDLTVNPELDFLPTAKKNYAKVQLGFFSHYQSVFFDSNPPSPDTFNLHIFIGDAGLATIPVTVRIQPVVNAVTNAGGAAGGAAGDVISLKSVFDFLLKTLPLEKALGANSVGTLDYTVVDKGLVGDPIGSFSPTPGTLSLANGAIPVSIGSFDFSSDDMMGQTATQNFAVTFSNHANSDDQITVDGSVNLAVAPLPSTIASGGAGLLALAVWQMSRRLSASMQKTS